MSRILGRSPVLGTCLACLLLVGISAAADQPEWSGFRGPGAVGFTDSANPPTEISAAGNDGWKTVVPMGKSSPVLWRERLYLTGSEGDQLLTLAFDANTGKQLWRAAVTAEFPHRFHELNDAAASTPVVDGERVYSYFPMFGLVAYGSDGKELWRVKINPHESEHGLSGSPILADGKLILVSDKMKESFVAAYDPSNGDLRWNTERESSIGAYSTPAYGRSASGRAEIIVSGPGNVIAYAPDTGKELWRFTGMAHAPKASPFILNGVAYVYGGGVPSKGGPFPYEQFLQNFDKDHDGVLRIEQEFPYPMSRSLAAMDKRYGNGDGILQKDEMPDFPPARRILAAIRMGGDGDVTATHALWTWEKMLSEVPTPLIHHGVVYVIHKGGILRTLDVKTGELLHEGRLPGELDDFYASPVAAGSKIYFATEFGKISVIEEAAGKWKPLSTNDLGEEIYATPALGVDRLYVRTNKALYCFRRQDAKPASNP